MSYASYDYYTGPFGGSTIPSPELFNGFELKAAAYVDKITFGRITEATDAVKNAVCAVADVIFNTSGHEGISSESNDGFSVNYADDATVQRQMYQAAKLFLSSDLLYRGL